MPITRRVLPGIIAGLAMLTATTAMAQTEAVHTIPRFTFEYGAVMENMRVGYTTWGRLYGAE